MRKSDPASKWLASRQARRTAKKVDARTTVEQRLDAIKRRLVRKADERARVKEAKIQAKLREQNPPKPPKPMLGETRRILYPEK